MDELLRELLDAIDAVAEHHEEIFDSECREQMSNPIFYLFIAPRTDYQMPNEFGLYSDQANQQVKAALAKYISSVTELAAERGIKSFHDRLAAFQNNEVQSMTARTFYDDYFGWMNPADFDHEGNVIGCS
ncbi:MAG: hypothetical protein J0M17_18595 [Planctomycetes bacterium]|nr:hypothetical protein [Planctomycetota bacterium]